MTTTSQKIRYLLLGEDNTDVLSDTYVSLVYDETSTAFSITDDWARIYYSCYLIASRWQGLGFVSGHDGVRYEKPDGKQYLQLFNDRMNDVNASDDANALSFFVKTTTNKDLVYDQVTHQLRRRLSYEE